MKQLQARGAIPNYLPGPCPYPCTDTRCQAYLNGYCGTVSDTIAVIKNPNNPYDYVGLQHNNGVAYIRGIVNSSSPTLATDILHYTKIYGSSVSVDTSGFDSWYNYATANGYFYLNDTYYPDSANLLNTRLYNAGKISSSALNYLNSINAAIDNTINDNSTPSSTLYNQIANRIVVIENNIKSDASLATNEKNGLLRCAAITRYTGAYWANHSSNISSSASINPQLSLFKNFSWKRFWHADELGALSGGAGGATGGWLGAFWGALLGGAAGSAGYAFFGD